MSQKKASGGVLLGPGEPVPSPEQRVRTTVGAIQQQLETVAEAVAALTPEERQEWTTGGVLSLMERLEAIAAVLTPLAMHMDQLLAWQAGMQQWQAAIEGKLLLGGRRQ